MKRRQSFEPVRHAHFFWFRVGVVGGFLLGVSTVAVLGMVFR